MKGEKTKGKPPTKAEKRYAVFAETLVTNPDATYTDAARAAGYAEKAIHATASKLVRHGKVQSKIRALEVEKTDSAATLAAIGASLLAKTQAALENGAASDLDLDRLAAVTTGVVKTAKELQSRYGKEDETERNERALLSGSLDRVLQRVTAVSARLVRRFGWQSFTPAIQARIIANAQSAED